MPREPVALESLGLIERDTMHERIYRQIRAALMSGELPAGQRLSFRGLAKALGTSPMPVRDAVHRLVAERALIAFPNRTIGVPRADLARITEVYRIRAELESLAAEQAVAHVTPASLEALEHLAQDMEHYLRNRRMADYGRANKDFHFQLYALSHIPLLVETIETLWIQIGPILLSHDGPVAESLALAHHREVLEALKRGDGPAAGAAIIADLQGGLEVVTEVFARAAASAAAAKPRGARRRTGST